MSPKLKVAVNLHIVNKIAKGDKKLFNILTTKCENVEVTLAEFAAIIDNGNAFSAQHTVPRCDKNFICSDIAAVDIDYGMTFEEILADPFVINYGGIVYKTPSHTNEHHRVRIIFVLPRTISDREEMVTIFKGLIRKFGGDKACKDASRAFYGSKGSDPTVLGNTLTIEQLEHLIALGRDPASVPDHTSTDGKKSYPIVARRSGVEILPSHSVTCANGTTKPFEAVSFGENIHCPVHIDKNPSAFVVKSKAGNKGVYCHSCAATFWMQSFRKSTKKTKFDFYRAERIIRQMEYEQDPGSYYDEDDAPEFLFEQAYIARTAHTFSKRYLHPNDVPLTDGVIFISSEKGSAKSELIDKKIAECRAKGYSVLLVTHRQTLAKKSSERFIMTCYFCFEDGKVKNNKPTDAYVICVDSIPKLLEPDRHKFDCVILDESEQIMRHLTGSTLHDKRRACYMQLFHYMSVAKSVIVADADLGAITVEGVYQAMGQDADYHYYQNEHRASKHEQRDFQHYTSEPHLMQEMLSAVGDGGRYYIATNSITKAEEMQAAIQAAYGNSLRIMLVTSKTAGLESVQEFISNITTEIFNYSVIIASPTLGTGIDISFPNGDQHIDTVYGFFVARVNTHFDADQQLSRVRNSGAVKVWVAPDTFSFETEPDVILREAELNGSLNDILIGYNRDGSKLIDKTYLNVYAHVTSIARASKNNLRQNLLDLRVRNGWNIVDVDVDQKAVEVGKIAKVNAKESIKNKRIHDICASPKLTTRDYNLLRDSISPPTKDEGDAIQRYDIENFYRENISAELLAMDKKGAYRRQLGLLEIYLSPTDQLVEKDYYESVLETIVTDKKKRTLKQLMLSRLLTSAGLADANSSIKLDAVITSGDLSNFAKVFQENASSLQDLFNMSKRDDLQKKPMTQLGIVLGRVGLSLEKFKTSKIGKTKKYHYRINSKDWDNAQHYLSLRQMKNDPVITKNLSM